MLKLQNYFSSIKPVFIDGSLYACIALLTFGQMYFGGDEAAKYIEPSVKFWLIGIVGCLAAMLNSIKSFRNTSYAEHQEAKKEEQKDNTTGT